MLLQTAARHGEHLGNLLAGAHPALHAQGRHPGAGGDFCPDSLPLLGQGVGNLTQGGVLGQLGLGNFQHGQLAVGGQPLHIFGAGILIEFLLQLAHADEVDTQHTDTSLELQVVPTVSLGATVREMSRSGSQSMARSRRDTAS